MDLLAVTSSISSAFFCEATRKSCITDRFSREEKLMYKWKHAIQRVTVARLLDEIPSCEEEGKKEAELIPGGNEGVRFYHNVFPDWYPFIC